MLNDLTETWLIIVPWLVPDSNALMEVVMFKMLIHWKGDSSFVDQRVQIVAENSANVNCALYTEISDKTMKLAESVFLVS